MQIRVVTLRYNEALQGFPEDALKAATFGREVLNANEHFFVHGNVPHLALVLSLGDIGDNGDIGDCGDHGDNGDEPQSPRSPKSPLSPLSPTLARKAAC